MISHFHAFAKDSGEVVEEVVAVVGDSPILASDADLAALVRLLPTEPDESREAYRSRLLEARVRLELQLRDVETSGILYRLDLDVPGAMTSLVERAGGESTVRERLADLGLTWADLEELALRVAAARAYAEQRLLPRVAVSLEEVTAAYRELAARLDAEGQPPPALVEVEDQLRRLLTERKLNAEIERWLQQAASRLEVTRFR